MNHIIDFLWVLLLCGSLAGSVQMLVRARARVKDSRIFQSEIVPYLIGSTVLMSLPWLVMGLLLVCRVVDSGMFFGDLPRNGWIYFWYTLLLAELLFFTSWVVWGGGAKFYVRYPFFLNASGLNERWLRVGALVFSVTVVGLFMWHLFE